MRALDLDHYPMEEQPIPPLVLPPHTCDDLNDPVCPICVMRGQMIAHYNKSAAEYRAAWAAYRGELVTDTPRRIEL